MDRKSFIQQLWKKVIRIFLYSLLGIVILSLLYEGIDEGVINPKVVILLNSTVLVFLAISFLYSYYVNKKKKRWPDASGYLRSKENISFLVALHKELEKNQDKASLTANVSGLIEKFGEMEFSLQLSEFLYDFKCHYGLFRSETIDYRFKKQEYTFEAGNAYFKESINKILSAKQAFWLDPMYERYTRWIYDNELRKEVTILDKTHPYILYKSLDSKDYFFEVMMSRGVGSWIQTFKVEDSVKALLEKALAENNKEEVARLADFVSQ